MHDIRRVFHKQIKNFWSRHPYLKDKDPKAPDHVNFRHFVENGFDWLPLVTIDVGVICEVDILMLRTGTPGNIVYDLDNRVKVIFDALRKAKGPEELGNGLAGGQFFPGKNETPFFVLLEDDSLITRASVTGDTLLEDVSGISEDAAVRLVVTITIKPYRLVKPSVLSFL